MRLLHTTKLDFAEFFNQDLPKYAILSHRWGNDEPSHQDWLDKNKVDGAGWRKVTDACRLAASRNHDYIWIDTICIDKRSSAELSEAINSMFSWYQGAAECYAYLFDFVSAGELTTSSTNPANHKTVTSSWFERGWTLQELLAPSSVQFFDRNWLSLGTKENLASHIAGITGIDQDVLRRPERLSNINIARKMSWVANRKTSRDEDMAYCLLGIFDVNMALLYGEGADKAFFRLQLEILSNTNDDSIFAWAVPNLSACGMLAPSPMAFADSGDIQTPAVSQRHNQRPWTWTNLGLELWLPDYSSPTSYTARSLGQKLDDAVLGPRDTLFGRDTEVFALTCWKRSKPHEAAPQTGWRFRDRAVRIILKKNGPAWRRIQCDRFLLGSEEDIEPAFAVEQLSSGTRAPKSVTYRLVYVLDHSARRNVPRMLKSYLGEPEVDPPVMKAWADNPLLSIDGGGFRNYWSLLVLDKLVECIAFEEEDLDEPHYHSFHPERFPERPRSNSLHGIHLAKPAHSNEQDLLSIPVSKRFLLCHYFDIFVGAGFGSFVALMLGELEMASSECLGTFETMVKDVFWSPRSLTAEVTRRYGTRAKYDSDKLQKFVRNRCAESNHPTRARKFATYTAVVECNENKHALRVLRMQHSKFGNAMDYAVEKIVTAAVATPNYLDIVVLRNGQALTGHVIGGFGVSINPTQHYLKLKAPTYYVSEETVVSVGTANHSNEKDYSIQGLATPFGVHQEVQVVAEKSHFDYFRLDPEPDEPMYHVTLDHQDEWEPAPGKGKRCGSLTMSKMQEAFDRWFANPDVQNYFIECARSLVARRRLRIQNRTKWAAHIGK